MDIPKTQLKYLVDRMHVGKSDDYVLAEIRRRTHGHAGWTQNLIAKAERYALQVHHDNQKMYDYVMGGSVGRSRNPRITGIGGAGIEDYIHAGDRVTYVDRFGVKHTGRAVMRGPGGWVLNMGGRYGTPAVVNNDMIVKVTRSRR